MFDLVGRILARRLWLVLGVALVTVVLGYTSSRLKIRSGFEDLLPPDFTSVKIMKEVPKRVGGPGFLVVALRGKDSQTLRDYADQLAPAFEKLDTVRFVIHKKSNQFIEDNRLLFLSLDELNKLYLQIDEEIQLEQVKQNPLVVSLIEPEDQVDIKDLINDYENRLLGEEPYFVSKEPYFGQHMLAILVKPRGYPSDLEFCRKLLSDVARVTKIIEPPTQDVSIHPLGAYRFNLGEYEALSSDLVMSIVVALLLICGVLIGYFRNFYVLLLVGLPPVVGLLWTFGLTYLIIGYLNSQTAFLAAILLGLVVDASIHLTSHYFTELEKSQQSNDSKQRVIAAAIISSIRPIGAAVLTTAGAFATLAFTDFLAFKHFGFIAAMGLVLCMVSTYILFGLLAYYLPVNDSRVEDNLWSSFVRQCSRKPLSLAKRYTFLFFIMSIALTSVFFVNHVGFEYDIDKLNTKNLSGQELMPQLETIFPRGLTPTVMLPDNLEEVSAVQNAFQKGLDTKAFETIDRVESIYSLLPENQNEKLAVIGKIEKLFDKNRKYLDGKYPKNEVSKWQKWLNVKSITIDALPDSLRELFRGIDGSEGLFVNVYPNVRLNDGKQLFRHVKEVRSIEAANKTFYAGGEAIIFADMLNLIKVDGKRALIYSILFIVIVLLILYRSVATTAVVLLPLLSGVALLIGFMVIFDVRLNFFNFLVFPSILGIGIDNGIHMVNRFKHCPDESIGQIIKYTGGAISLTSITTIIGFSTLLISNNQALFSVGLLAVVGVGLCWFCSLTILPIVLSLYSRRR